MHGTMNIKNICKMKREYQPDKDKETRISKKKRKIAKLNQGFMKSYIN